MAMSSDGEASLEAWFLHDKLVLGLLPEQDAVSLRERLPDPSGAYADTARTELFERVLIRYLEQAEITSLAEAHPEGAVRVGQLVYLDQAISFKGMSAALEAIERGARRANASFSAFLAPGKRVRVHGTYNVRRLTSSTAVDMLTGTKRQFLLGYVENISEDTVELRPVVIGRRRLRPEPEVPIVYADDPLWVPPRDVDQFANVDFELPLERADLNLLKKVPEKKVKYAFARILNEPEVPNDWGGEQFDLWTAMMSVRGRPVRAAFAFKGPAVFRPMVIAHLGKNGDQISRLAHTAADVMVVQHCHAIRAPVMEMLQFYARGSTPRRLYMAIDGYDTIRILRHFGEI